MAGTREGGLKAAQTNKAKYGQDFYAKAGSLGGTQTYKSGQLHRIGFAGDIERAREAGRKGGKVSKRSIALTPTLAEITTPPKPSLYKRLFRRAV